MVDDWSIVDDFLEPLALMAAFFLIILGIMWGIYASYEANRRKSWRKLTGVDDWDFDITKFLKVLTFLGFIVGIFSILTGAAGLILDMPPSIAYSTTTANEVNYFTSIFLIFFGILTLMKPLNDLPIASIIGFAVSTLITVAVLAGIMYLGISISTTIAVILIVLFLIIFGIVAVTIKFYTAGLMFLSKIISWPPIAIVLVIFCFIQGFVLLVLGTSIV